ncbi:MAG: hypothetical protein SVU32_02015 [Candidatus Nanohaloarchaea archaeon]|nr:hypothetical protein [Candidatus Nanohaloarchaea archaeon]
MTDFTYVALGATALFVIGGLIAGMTDAPGAGVETPGDNASVKMLFEKEIGVIGDLNETPRTVFGPQTIEVEYRSPNKTVMQTDSLTIRKGGFGEPNAKIINFDAMRPEALYVTFTVAGSNPSGDLIFKLNGHTEKRFRPDEGRTYTVKLTNFSAGRNTLFITTEDTGYTFWSPTKYALRDVKVQVKDMAVRKNTKTFIMYPYQLPGFKRGTIEFFVRESPTATAPLKIDINGNMVMERSPVKRNLPYTTQFSKAGTDLHPGENTISFYTKPGASYTLSTVTATVEYFVTTQTRQVSDTFTIPLVTYRLMGADAAQIRFDVEAVNVPGQMRIQVNNKTYTLQPGVGTRTIQVSKEVLQQGENEVRLTTSGSYKIKNFRIVRKTSDSS